MEMLIGFFLAVFVASVYFRDREPPRPRTIVIVIASFVVSLGFLNLGLI